MSEVVNASAIIEKVIIKDFYDEKIFELGQPNSTPASCFPTSQRTQEKYKPWRKEYDISVN